MSRAPAKKPADSGPTPLQALLVWALVARGGAALQNELRPALTKPDRDALTRAGLLATGKRGRAVTVELTDRGWAWATSNTNAALPANTNAGTLVLRDLLARLGGYMAAHEVALADLIRHAAPAAPSPPDNLPDRLRAACLAEAADAANRRIRLAALRARLSDVARPDLDAALLALTRAGDADLLPLDDPRDITPADRDAAIAIGAEARHLLWLHR